MYALMQDTPYEGEWPLEYFETENEARAALFFIYSYDEIKHPNYPRTEWDWGYFVKEITPVTLAEFKAQYENKETPNEEVSYGGDNCFIGRMWQSESNPLAIVRSQSDPGYIGPLNNDPNSNDFTD